MFSPGCVPVRGFANSRKDLRQDSRNGAHCQQLTLPGPSSEGPMSPHPASDHMPGQPGPLFEPYVRLVRSLLPRTSSVVMFGPAGDLQWSTDPTTGPDLTNVIEDALLAVRSDPANAGQLRLLEGNIPID